MYLLFDIGKTNMRFATTRDLRELAGETVKVKTPDTFAEGLAEIRRIARELCGDEEIEAVGGGIGGPFDKMRGTLLNFPHEAKRDWIGKPVKDELEKLFGAPAIVENDSAVVGLGEAYFGAGRGFDIAAYMTVSTGVGGARIVRGAIDSAAIGYEPGHQFIDFDATACTACESGTLGNYVSGTATERRFGVKPYEVESRAEWDTIARWLAHGLVNSIVHWSPDVVVLGGSMVVKKPGIYVSDVQKHLAELLTIFPPEYHPPVVEATCGDNGGLYGAMKLIEQRRGMA